MAFFFNNWITSINSPPKLDPPELDPFPTANELRAHQQISASGFPKMTHEAIKIINKLNPSLQETANANYNDYVYRHHTKDYCTGGVVASYLRGKGYMVDVHHGAIDIPGIYDPYITFSISWSKEKEQK